MLNVPNIKHQLKITPLCSGSLVKQVGLATEYCAVGALAKGVGITDEQLRSVGGGDVFSIFHMNSEGFKEKYGIDSPTVLGSFMGVNDREPSILHRTEKVVEKVEDEQIDAINNMIAELITV